MIIFCQRSTLGDMLLSNSIISFSADLRFDRRWCNVPLALTVSDVCLKLGCFQSSYSTLEISQFMRYIFTTYLLTIEEWISHLLAQVGGSLNERRRDGKENRQRGEMRISISSSVHVLVMRWYAEQGREAGRQWRRRRPRPASGWCSHAEVCVVETWHGSCWGHSLPQRPTSGRRRRRPYDRDQDGAAVARASSAPGRAWCSARAGPAEVRRREIRRSRLSCRRCSKLDRTHRSASWSASVSRRRSRPTPRTPRVPQTAARCTRSTTEWRQPLPLGLVEDWIGHHTSSVLVSCTDCWLRDLHTPSRTVCCRHRARRRLRSLASNGWQTAVYLSAVRSSTVQTVAVCAHDAAGQM